MPASLKNGIISEEELRPRRNSLILQVKPASLEPRDSQDWDAERFFREWASRPADLHGTILPHLSGAHIKLWKLCFAFSSWCCY